MPSRKSYFREIAVARLDACGRVDFRQQRSNPLDTHVRTASPHATRAGSVYASHDGGMMDANVRMRAGTDGANELH